ncbi:MAG: oxidoreductase [Methylocystaceae bacterium]|nr:MAG: oxidoreductase [Methylocystaceae bacterium]
MTSAEGDITLAADVLIIGGGMAGAWAAASAAREGARVVLVEKGYCGASGVTAASGPGHWWVPPPFRDKAVRERASLGLGLAEPDWMRRIIEETWERLPTLAPFYEFPRDEDGVVQYRGVRGPEYMRALRALVASLGVTILDQAPALELLARSDGSIGGARGVLRQRGGAIWRVAAGATVLATGGTSFLSHLLGAGANTGDGHLMAAEAGVALSGLEFNAAYTVAPARTTMTRMMSYAFADYYDADGNELDRVFGPRQIEAIARALLRGPVYCSLRRMPEDIRAHLSTISPNVTLTFARVGIDPFNDRFEITLRADGTIRGQGGVQVSTSECGVSVPGLFVAGDVATRELVAGAISGGGNINAAWALSSGTWAGRGAARFARKASRPAELRPLGGAGLRPKRAMGSFDARAVKEAVRKELLPYDKVLFRTGESLRASRHALDGVHREVVDHAGGGADPLAAREAAALTAVARWSVAAAAARDETRGTHRRADRPEIDAGLGHRILTGGLDDIWTRPDGAAPPAPEPVGVAHNSARRLEAAS